MAYLHTPYFVTGGQFDRPTMNIRWVPAPNEPVGHRLEQQWETVENYPGGSRVIERAWRPVPVVSHDPQSERLTPPL